MDDATRWLKLNICGEKCNASLIIFEAGKRYFVLTGLEESLEISDFRLLQFMLLASK